MYMIFLNCTQTNKKELTNEPLLKDLMQKNITDQFA
jgi:hypothetical protein